MCTHLIHRLVMGIASLHKFALLSHRARGAGRAARWCGRRETERKKKGARRWLFRMTPVGLAARPTGVT
jgi:hypothetical protein